MEESILFSVKKMLGIDCEYQDFDFDITMSINSAIHTLYQVGYDNAKNFIVEGPEQTWEDLAGECPSGVISLIKTYIYAKVRVLFDPPTSSFVLTSLENQAKELEWRIYAEMEGGFDDDKDEDESEEDSGCNCGDGSDDDDESDGDGPCGQPDPWEGVPGNGPDDGDSGDQGESDGCNCGDGTCECGDECPGRVSDALRRLRNEMGRP